MQAEASQNADADSVAAALAALQLYLADNEPAAGVGGRPRWQIAAVRAAQGLEPARNQAHNVWAAAERVSRVTHWSSGLLGTFG